MFYFAVCIFPWVGHLYSDGKTSQLRRQDVAIVTALPKMKKTNLNYRDGDAIPVMVKRHYSDCKMSQSSMASRRYSDALCSFKKIYIWAF